MRPQLPKMAALGDLPHLFRLRYGSSNDSIISITRIPERALSMALSPFQDCWCVPALFTF